MRLMSMLGMLGKFDYYLTHKAELTRNEQNRVLLWEQRYECDIELADRSELSRLFHQMANEYDRKQSKSNISRNVGFKCMI